MPTYLRVPGIDADFVEPALRSHFMFLGALSARAERLAVSNLVAFLRRRHEGVLTQVVTRGGKQRNGKKPISARTWQVVEAWIASPKQSGDSLVIASGDHRDAVPAVVITIDRKKWFVEVALPPVVDVAACDELSAMFADCAWLWGVQGFGVYMSASEEEYVGHLGPLDISRMRCALQLTSSHVEEGVTPTGALLSDDHHAVGAGGPLVFGIPDIGWRTIVGPSFITRLAQQKAPMKSGLLVAREAKRWTITAGPEPVWGTPKEDLTAWYASAAFLAPLQFDRRIAMLRFFRGVAEPARYPFARQKLKRFKAWWSRFGAKKAPAKPSNTTAKPASRAAPKS